MPSSLSRRKKGLILGFGLMSAAALVAFGTARYKAQKKRPAPENGTEGEGGEPEAEQIEEQGLWARATDIGRAALMLFTNRKLRD